MTATKEKMMELAKEAADKMFDKIGDWYPCGFAWVTIEPKFKGNTKDGKAERKILADLGFTLDYTGKKFQFWNPSKHMAQNVDVKMTGARVAADYLVANGFKAYAESRLD